MAEIIRKGNKHIVTTCKHCGCVFSYISYEIRKVRNHNYIDCPDCFGINIIAEKNNIKTEDNENV